MIKLILTDMDGTLLDANSKLPPDFDEVVGKLKEKGVMFAPASGRQYFSLLESFPKYKEDFLFIAENGSVAYYKGEEILSFPMDKNEATSMLGSVTNAEAYKVFCGKNYSYVLKEHDNETFRKEEEKYFPYYKTVDSFEEVDDVPVKISFYDPKYKAKEQILPKVLHYEKDYEVINSSDAWVDIMAKGVSKGLALKKAREIFKIDMEECAAFGDYMNDTEMLLGVGYAYAMENAHENLKKVAKFIAPKNTDYGVTKTIKTLLDEGFMG